MPGSIPFDCAKLSTSGEYNAWEDNMKKSINSNQNGGSQSEHELLKLENDMQSVTFCILNEINKLGASSTDIAEMQQNILSKTAELVEAEKDIALAKDRVAYIRHPEEHTSNYESWFPINRPMNSISLIILIAISIFLGMFYILMLLSAFDLDIVLYMSPKYYISPFFMQIMQQLTVSFWVVLIALIAVVIYFVKRK